MEIKEYLLNLHVCPGIGVASEHRILNFIQQTGLFPNKNDLSEILKLQTTKASQIIYNLNSKQNFKLVQDTLKIAKAVTLIDDNYPQKLKETYHPPLVMFYQGNLTLAENKILAVVGARQNSQYANLVLQTLLPQIVSQNIVTVSGLAQGVDSICRRITLANAGKTIGVIGTGLDFHYPKCNFELQEYLGANHLVLTEYPVSQGPKKHHFPMRNRIIAGLCDSLLVVEAKKRSGSLITANLALEENRNVLAVPGRIDHSLSAGCNQLISEGAKMILSSADIMEEFR